MLAFQMKLIQYILALFESQVRRILQKIRNQLMRNQVSVVKRKIQAGMAPGIIATVYECNFRTTESTSMSYANFDVFRAMSRNHLHVMICNFFVFLYFLILF